MVPEIRKKFNELFKDEAYKKYVQALKDVYPGQLEFRIAETPIFVPKKFADQMLSACDHILDRIKDPAYKKASERAIPPGLAVPNEDAYPHFIAFDFGVCKAPGGGLEPQLIEMQGFPSLFAWEVLLPEIERSFFWTPEGATDYLGGFKRESYVKLLRDIIVADEDPSEVVLLEIYPHLQKTRVDFYATAQLIGIAVLDLNDVIKEGNKLFYLKDGKKTRIKRIYNRVIFDDLQQQPPEVQAKGKIFQEELDVTWVPHPNWFYKLSKFTLPFIDHPNVPATKFLNETEIPEDLTQYVVKPLFSFAGQGVIIDVTKEDIENIKDPENWIIQKKVDYAGVIETPDEPAKAEIRLFYFWPPGADRPVPVNNLARLSKGKMIGVRYNKDREWVGGSFAFFLNE